MNNLGRAFAPRIKRPCSYELMQTQCSEEAPALQSRNKYILK